MPSPTPAPAGGGMDDAVAAIVQDMSRRQQIPSAQEVYDALMGAIEPELTTGQMALLGTKYANEDPAQAAQRRARYDKAFARYDQALEAFAIACTSYAREMQHTIIATIESFARKDDDAAMQAMESVMSKEQ